MVQVQVGDRVIDIPQSDWNIIKDWTSNLESAPSGVRGIASFHGIPIGYGHKVHLSHGVPKGAIASTEVDGGPGVIVAGPNEPVSGGIASTEVGGQPGVVIQPYTPVVTPAKPQTTTKTQTTATTTFLPHQEL